MGTHLDWIIVRIDGKIAAISTDYRLLAEISARLAGEGRKPSRANRDIFSNITATAATFEQVLELRKTTRWEDLMLFGTEFQIKVWQKLWEQKELVCYSDFADMCQNRAGVRAVAHAVGLNPVAVLIPCHLVVPKESIDRIREIQRRAESTIFKGDDLCLDSILRDPAIDYGEYALGRDLKRELILMDVLERHDN